jgi:hypothetical protein
VDLLEYKSNMSHALQHLGEDDVEAVASVDEHFA